MEKALVPFGKMTFLDVSMIPSRRDQLLWSCSAPGGKGLMITAKPIRAFLSMMAPSI
jgi:hypothetical protein